MKEVDLLIIGAGPAGLSTALHLLQLDPDWASRMVVIEKATHPREKLCAGGLTRLGIKVLKDLDFSFPLPIPHVLVNTVNFVYQGRAFKVENDPNFIVFNRMEFDNYLVEVARERGVLIHEGEAVRQLEVSPGGVVVTTTKDTYHAQAVVGADGSTGVTQRWRKRNSPSPKITPHGLARALEVRVPADAESPLFLKNQAIFDFSPTKDGVPGYVWNFPSFVNGIPHYNRGIYDALVIGSHPRAKLPTILKDALAEDVPGIEKIKLPGFPISKFSPSNYFAAPRILLVGDAAGAEVVFGEGIGPALGYGEIATHELEKAFAEGDFSFKRYRWHILFSSLGWYLSWRWAFASFAYRLSKRPWFMHLLWIIIQVFAKFIDKRSFSQDLR